MHIDTMLTKGMAGTVVIDPKATMKGERYESPMPGDDFPDIEVDFL